MNDLGKKGEIQVSSVNFNTRSIGQKKQGLIVFDCYNLIDCDLVYHWVMACA